MEVRDGEEGKMSGDEVRGGRVSGAWREGDKYWR